MLAFSNAYAQTNDAYGLLFRDFTAERVSITQFVGEQFNVNYNIRNPGSQTFNGSLSAVLVDSAGIIAAVIGSRDSTSFGAGSGRASFVTCSVPNTVRSGQYQLRIVVKPSDNEQKIINMSEQGIPISINFEVRANTNVVVAPLIQTRWTQFAPYNDLFPLVSGQHSVTDCGNLALAQIIRFHKYPVRGNGQSTRVRINSDTFTVPSVNFNVAYDWNNMLDTYTTANPGSTRQRNATATLVYHVAAAVGLNTPERSNYPSNYTAALTDIFGYDKSVQIHYRLYYNDKDWEAMIRQQLDLGLPVYYWGNDPKNNHAFVIDGYNNSGLFHINLGWSGRDNGWYSLNNINPSTYDGARKFYNNHLIIINIKPDEGGMPADYEMALNSFSANKTSVSQNELFTVTMQIKNISTFGAFSGGQQGVAVVNNNGGIIAVIGNNNRAALNQQSLAAAATINCIVPATVIPGQYRLMAVVRETGEEWKLITKSAIGDGIPGNISITVTAGEANGGGYGMALAAFTANNTTVSRNTSFNVGYRLTNVGLDVFDGQAGAALVDNNNNIVTVLRSWNTGRFVVGARNANPISIACTIPNSIVPGQYKLRMVLRPNANEAWKITTLFLENSPTSIDFTVR